MALCLEPLNRSHRPLLADFQNPQASLVDDLQRYALRHAEKDLLSPMGKGKTPAFRRKLEHPLLLREAS